MSDSLPYQQCRQLKAEAEQLLRDQKYTEAALLYRQAYELCNDSFAASKYLSCSRRIGAAEAREALKLGQQAMRLFPDNIYIRNEYIWTMYDAYLKIANGEGSSFEEDADEVTQENREQPSHDFAHMIKAARYILGHTDESLPRWKAVEAICKEAKRLKKWETVYAFAKELDPTKLSNEQKEWDGRHLPSDYQKWLNLINRAQLELGYYDECRAYASEAIEKFPKDSFFFYRRNALAQIRQGEIEVGVQQLEYINKRFPKQWYVQKEIAEAYRQLKQDETSWLWFCQAAYAPGDVKGRIVMLDSMCDLLQQLEHWREMYEHLLLVWSIQIDSGNSQRIERARQRVLACSIAHQEDLSGNVNLEPIPLAVHVALRPCRSIWEKTIRASRPRQQGQIVNLKESFGFIQSEGGERIHFKLRAFRGQPEIGMQVEFEVEESFDPKRDELSLTAVRIHPVRA